MNKDLEWVMFIPRMGSGAFGCEEALGKKPLYMLSWEALKDTDSGCREYWNDVPYYLIEDNPDLSCYKKPDIVFSVCPCGGISTLNTSKGKMKGVNAPQNDFMYKTAEYVLSNIKPTVYYGENGQGLFEKRGSVIVENLKEIAKKYDYSFSLFKTDAELHGVPQRRIRTFYIFWKFKNPPIMNWIRNKYKGKIIDFLSEIPKDCVWNDVFLYKEKPSEWFKPYKFLLEKLGITHEECVRRYPRYNVTEILVQESLLDECIEWLNKTCPESTMNFKYGMTFETLYKKYRSKLESGKGIFDRSPYFCTDRFKAITRSNVRRFVHPVEDRYLSLREFAHLMGYPLDYQCTFSNKNTGSIENYQLLTKGVVRQVSRDVCKEIVECLSGNRDFSGIPYIRQDNCSRANGKL